MSDTKFLRQISETLQYMLAAKYTERYQSIVRKLPKSVFEGDENVTEEVHALLHSYIDLCAEEVMLHKQGQVPDAIWNTWREGIIAGNTLPAVMAVWKSSITSVHYNELSGFLTKNNVQIKEA